MEQAGTGPSRCHIQGSIGGPFGEFFFRKKSRNAEKTERGTLWSRPALYVMRETFWFCSLGQQVKFEIL